MCMIDAMRVTFQLKGISWSTTKFKVQQIYTNQLLRAETCWSLTQSENSIPVMKIYHPLLRSWEVAAGIILSQLNPFQTLHLFLFRSIFISLLLIWMICPGLFILLRVCPRICKCLRPSLTFHNMLVVSQWRLSVPNPTLKLKHWLPTTASLFNSTHLQYPSIFEGHHLRICQANLTWKPLCMGIKMFDNISTYMHNWSIILTFLHDGSTRWVKESIPI